MKVLFVCSGNSDNFEITPFIQSQAESIKKMGVDIDYFLIKKKGLKGYFKFIFLLRDFLKNKNYDIIHAHYVLSGWVSVLGGRKTPVICSFMGSDTYGDSNQDGRRTLSSYIFIFLAYLIQPFLSAIIVKSKNLYNHIWMKQKAFIVPNGINMEHFKPMDKNECRSQLNFENKKRIILFMGNRKDPRKNYSLINKAINMLQDENIELVTPYPVSSSKVPIYINAADVLVLTSYLEGSPNVIKEAMACNCPIVSTEVGDVKWVLGNVRGCYISSYNSIDLAHKIQEAILFEKKTNGRRRIIEIGLDSDRIAKRIIKVYKEILLQSN